MDAYPPPPAACWPCPHESWASLGFDSTLITVLRHWVLETAEEGGLSLAELHR